MISWWWIFLLLCKHPYTTLLFDILHRVLYRAGEQYPFERTEREKTAVIRIRSKSMCSGLNCRGVMSSTISCRYSHVLALRFYCHRRWVRIYHYNYLDFNTWFCVCSWRVRWSAADGRQGHITVFWSVHKERSKYSIFHCTAFWWVMVSSAILSSLIQMRQKYSHSVHRQVVLSPECDCFYTPGNLMCWASASWYSMCRSVSHT